MAAQDASYDAAYYENNGSSGDRIALRWYAALIEQHAPPGPALDFGSGPGWMVRRTGRSRPCDGVEISAYSREQCRRLNPEAAVFGSTGEIPDGSYAAASAIHVLEHIPDDDIPGAVAELFRVLLPGGILLVVTPDLHGRAAAICADRWRALSDPTHINLQGHEYWRSALRGAGFDLVAEGTDGLWDPPYTGWLADRARLPRIAIDVVRGRLSMPVGAGESYLCVARRPDLG